MKSPRSDRQRASLALKAALERHGLDFWSEDPDERESIRYTVTMALGIDVASVAELTDAQMFEAAKLLEV